MPNHGLGVTARVDASAAVYGLLSRFGPHDEEQLWNNLDRAYTRVEVRAALKKLGAQSRKYRDWPRFDGQSQPVSRKARSGGKLADDGPAFVIWFVEPSRLGWTPERSPVAVADSAE